MTGPKLYGIYTARFPFLDSDNDKIRPVIVVSAAYGEHSIVAIIPVSSRPKREAADINLNDWQSEGLLRPSVARVHRITTMLQADLLAELGEATEQDKTALRQALKNFLTL